MKSFDETYTDREFQRQIDQARVGWMSEVPRATQPDLRVDGLRGSIFARVVGVFSGHRR